LAYVVRVDDRVSVAHVAATLGVRVKSGRVVHRCRVAVLVAAAYASGSASLS
jgi:hypothetical protein